MFPKQDDFAHYCMMNARRQFTHPRCPKVCEKWWHDCEISCCLRKLPTRLIDIEYLRLIRRERPLHWCQLPPQWPYNFTNEFNYVPNVKLTTKSKRMSIRMMGGMRSFMSIIAEVSQSISNKNLKCSRLLHVVSSSERGFN